MSVTSPTIPQIAITAEESDGEVDTYDGPDIADALTDVEDLDLVGETSSKKTKLRKKAELRRHSNDSTDEEEFEGVGNELASTLVEHENPFSVDDVLTSEEPPTYDETFKVEGRGPKNRRKLKTQTSTSAATFLNLDDHGVNQGLTDVEDFNDSGDDIPINNESDFDDDILAAMSQDMGVTEMSDNVKNQMGNAPSPIHTPCMVSSDNEQEVSKGLSANLQIPTKGKYLVSPVSLSPQLSDLTDVEILQSNDSDEEEEVKIQKKTRNRRRNRRGIKEALTDTEDIYISDNEKKKTTGEVLLTDSPNFHRKQYKCQKHRSESVPTMTSYKKYLDDSKESRIRAFKKKNSSKLNVEVDTAGTTDIEDIEAGESAMEDNEPDDNFDEEIESVIKNEFESYYGSTEDKNTTKCNKKLYKTESYVVKSSSSKMKIQLDESYLTDEECYDQETPMEDRQFTIEEGPCVINFVPYKPKDKKEKSTSLLVVQNNEEGVTDNEYLNSSDEEREVSLQFAAVISINRNKDDTDYEDVDEVEESSQINDIDIPSELIPDAKRTKITIKETQDHSNIIIESAPLEEEVTDEFVYQDNLTDVEEVTGDDNISEKEYIAPDINLECSDAGCMSTTEKMKQEKEAVEASEGETDYEEIANIKPTRKKKETYLTDFLKAKNVAEESKLTDCEDIELSDAENIDNTYDVREINNRSSSIAGERTDMEDFAASDDNIERTVYTPDPSVSRKVLNEICGGSVVSKEGSGPFSKQERKKLYKKNRPVDMTPSDVTPGSPMQTDTDEMFTSADDESHSYSRAETATPAQMRQALDDATNSKVTTQYTKKLDLEAADEVMYIKGGGFISDQHTDVEEMGISEEEYHTGFNKNKVCVRIDGQNEDINISVSGNGDEPIAWKNEWRSSREQSAELVTSPDQSSPPEKDTAQQETSGTSQETTSRTVAGTAATQPMRDEEKEDGSTQQQRSDLHDLSSEMKELLEEMEKQAKK